MDIFKNIYFYINEKINKCIESVDNTLDIVKSSIVQNTIFNITEKEEVYHEIDINQKINESENNKNYFNKFF